MCTCCEICVHRTAVIGVIKSGMANSKAGEERWNFQGEREGEEEESRCMDYTSETPGRH